MPVRILIADDHEVVRQGLRSLLRSHPEWDVCGEASDGREAVEKARQLRPDVVVLDVSMPNLNGLEAARCIRKEVPQSEILILSQHESRQMVKEAISAGARGYVVKTDMSRDLISAVEAVSQHRALFSTRIAESHLAKKMTQSDTVPEPAVPLHSKSQAPASATTAPTRTENTKPAEIIELRYRQLLDALPNLVFIADADGIHVDHNSRCAEYFGVPQENLIGQRWTRFVHPEDQAEL